MDSRFRGNDVTFGGVFMGLGPDGNPFVMLAQGYAMACPYKGRRE